MPAETKDERLNLSLPRTMVSAIDEWRRHQPDIPNRSEAARRLIEAGLSAKPGKGGKG